MIFTISSSVFPTDFLKIMCDTFFFSFLFFPQPHQKTTSLWYLSYWTHEDNLEYLCVISCLCWTHYLGAPWCSPGNQGCWCPWIKTATQAHGGYRIFMSRSIKNCGLPIFWATQSFLDLAGRLWLRVGFEPVHL